MTNAETVEVEDDCAVLGRLQFGALESVNRVALRSKYLIIAAGLGGLKSVEIH